MKEIVQFYKIVQFYNIVKVYQIVLFGIEKISVIRDKFPIQGIFFAYKRKILLIRDRSYIYQECIYIYNLV